MRWTTLEVPEIVQFATVVEKVDLERILRLAQIAVLNPHLDPIAVRMSNNTDQKTALGFSFNLVHLEIASSELPELSLFDLPGAILLTERDEDQHLVTLVDQLLTSYISEEKAIVLLAAAANADVETCKAFNIIRKKKAISRCLGVITKPDLIDRGAISRVHKMLAGEIWTLGKGWWVTKQLSQGGA